MGAGEFGRPDNLNVIDVSEIRRRETSGLKLEDLTLNPLEDMGFGNCAVGENVRTSELPLRFLAQKILAKRRGTEISWRPILQNPTEFVAPDGKKGLNGARIGWVETRLRKGDRQVEKYTIENNPIAREVRTQFFQVTPDHQFETMLDENGKFLTERDVYQLQGKDRIQESDFRKSPDGGESKNWPSVITFYEKVDGRVQPVLRDEWVYERNERVRYRMVKRKVIAYNKDGTPEANYKMQNFLYDERNVARMENEELYDKNGFLIES